MSTALAFASLDFDEYETASAPTTYARGAEGLLVQPQSKPFHWAQGAAAAIYLLGLAGAAFYSAKPATPVQEDAIELVMLPSATPEEPPAPPPEPPPVAEETPPEPVADLAPPPPVAEEPAVAPVEPPKPLPKPVVKPKPKVVESKPVQQPHTAQSNAPSQTNVPANAIASGYANQVHARVAAAVAGLASRPGHPTGRVGYSVVISPSGSLISHSIHSSGNPALDAQAEQRLAGISFPATGMTRNASLTGAIVVR